MPALKPTITQVGKRGLDQVGDALGGAAQTVGAGAAGAVQTLSEAPDAAVSAGSQALVDEGKKQAKNQANDWLAANYWTIILGVIGVIVFVFGIWYWRRRGKRADGSKKSRGCFGSSKGDDSHSGKRAETDSVSDGGR